MNRRTVAFILLFYILISQFYATSTATYVDDEHIVILRSQFVEDAPEVIDGKINEPFWINSGLLSLKIVGSSSQEAEIQFRFANDDDNLYIAFALLNYVYLDVSVTVYFDADNNGVLSTPEDGKLVSFTRGSSSETLKDLYWDGNVWLEDSNSENTGYEAGVHELTNSNNTGIEMAIPLLSSDLGYDGLQVPSTSNSYISMMFSIVNNFNNGTIETFEFPTTATNASGYVDLRLAGPEDKDLPSYVPPVQITTTIQSAATETFTANADDDGVQADSAGFNLYLAVIGIFVTNIVLRRRRR
ncbi:MAG: hypothetical protein GPJ54_18795 [Candidatus Heimdallarchaeota archaeon]|nr:hypothetical protein [Candidatus Heimdallarchaeota archaeon]